MSSRDRLPGRRILITGAASGIGRATAELFAREGARVALLDRDAAGLAETARGIGTAVTVTVDLAVAGQVAAAVEEAARALGGLDGVVNAAAICIHRPLAEIGLELWQQTLQVNLTGTFLVCQAALPHLQAAGSATIVNLVSGAALLPHPTMAAYAASKGGVIALSKVLAAELAPGIRVNMVAPGATRTPMAGWSPGDDRATAKGDRYALKRIAEPLEIAQAVLYLTSSDSSFVTGSTLVADGGRVYH